MDQPDTDLTLPPAPPVPVQADSDATLLQLWLHGRPAETQRAYAADLAGFLGQVGKPLRAVTVGDVQAFATSLAGLAPASRARKLSAVKSLLGFAHRVGYVAFNVGAPIRLPAIKATLAERILVEPDIHRLLALETTPRNAALLLLVYAAGLRISEAAGLSRRDLQPRGDAGQATIFGKGGKTRAILLPARVWQSLAALPASGRRRPGVPLRQGRPSRRLADPPHRQGRRRPRRTVRRGLSTLAAPRPRLPRTRPRSPIHLVQSTLGHASVATTGRYLHARPNDSSSRYLAV